MGVEISAKLKKRLEELPRVPGVYLFKDSSKNIVYIGKAANLRRRVRQYFQSSRSFDVKTKLLVGEIAAVDWLEVDSEVEALFLESELIKRYKPKYNIDLKDDKNWLYIRIPLQDEFPVVSFVRRPLDDGAQYCGPFTSRLALRKALRFLRKAFPYVTHKTLPKRACLHYQLGLCPGPEIGAISAGEYKRQLRRLMRYLRGQGSQVRQQLEREMKRAAKAHEFEKAAALRDRLSALRSLSRQHIFSDKELFDLSRDQALVGLAERLGLKGVPRRIEAYDVSHLQGTFNTASMVVFSDGVPNRGAYRKFKLQRPGNDDYAHMREVVARRFSPRNLRRWPKPDLIVIDGGKGQLNAALDSLDELGLSLPAVGLAKREETIISVREGKEGRRYQELKLPRAAHTLKLLQHIRDEAHRFAVTYHTALRSRAQVASLLESIPGIGPVTRRQLLRRFGSLKGVEAASEAELAAVVGASKARILTQALGKRP